jgi:hypothetical protein
LSIISKKPEYNRFASLDEKIAFMKRHGKQYGVADFHSIMRIVNDRNIIHLKPDKSIDRLGGFKDMLDYFDEKDSQLVERRLRELLRKTVEEYDPTSAVHEERSTNRKLNRYLQRANEGMREVILSFLDSHANITNSQLNRLEEFLNKITKWEITDLATITREIQNMAYNLAKVYPNLIIKKGLNTSIPKHWGFAPAHQVKLEDWCLNYYQEIKSFSDANKDSIMNRYLATMVGSLTDLVLFLEQIPRISPLIRDGIAYWNFYTNDTVLLLHEYCVLSILHEYIVLSNDRDFVQMREEEIRGQRLERRDDDVYLLSSGAAYQVQEINIVESDLAELKRLVGKLVFSMIERERETKRAIDRNYSAVIEQTSALKYKDKKQITDYMKGLTSDERRIEQTLRSQKLGRWNIGMQKGLYQYDTNVYQQEIEFWDKDDAVGRALANLTVGGEEVDDLERMEDHEHAVEYNNGDGIEHLDEDYTDGIYYEEDAEREDYDEY